MADKLKHNRVGFEVSGDNYTVTNNGVKYSMDLEYANKLCDYFDDEWKAGHDSPNVAAWYGALPKKERGSVAAHDIQTGKEVK